jgi:subtilisin family serine protease
MVSVARGFAVMTRRPTRVIVALACALLSGPFAGRALPNAETGPAASRRLVLGQGSSAEEPRKGEVRYRASGRDGTARTFTLASPYEHEAIVKLRGLPLADEWRAARPSGSDGRTKQRRLRGRMPASVAQAAERLRLQQTRVGKALERFGAEAARTHGGSAEVKIRHHYTRAFNGLAVRASAEVLERLRQDPDVEYVRPAVRVTKTLAESTTLVGAPELWAQGLTGTGVVVGIIDSGVDYTHPDLGGGYGPTFKVIGGYDFVNDDDDPTDDNGHGTHVAGIVAANGAVKGVAPDARIVAYKVLDAHGGGWTSDVIAAIEKACDPDGDPLTDDALDVINLSLGGPGSPDDPVSQAIDNAFAAGVLPVVAAGNEGHSGDRTLDSPGCARNALTVGASDDADRIAPFSSRGPTDFTHAIKPDLVAPGVDIWSTIPGGRYLNASGTSMATPHVAGAAALLLQRDPSLTPGALKSRLMLSARDVGAGLFSQGTGRLDLPAALALSTTVIPASLSFGLDDPAWPEFTGTAVLSVTNDTAAARDYTVSLDGELPEGLTVAVSPGSFTLSPGTTVTLTVGIHADNSAVPDVSESPYGYLGRIQIASDAEQLRVPFSLVKSPSLTFSFDAPVDAVHVYNDQGRMWSLYMPWQGATLLLPRGQYHMLARGLEFPAPRAIRVWQVLQEGVTAPGATAVRRVEARHVVRAAPRDVGGSGMFGVWDYRLRAPVGDLTFETLPMGFSDVEFHLSDMAETHLLDWLFDSWSTPDSYFMWWHSTGLSSGRDLTNEPGELREARVHFDVETKSSDLWSFVYVMAPGGKWDVASGWSGFGPPYVRTYYLMGDDDPNAWFRGVQFSVATSDDLSQPALDLTPMVTPRGERLELSLNGRSDLDESPIHTPLALVDAGELTFGLEPQSWFGRFLNEDGRIRLRSSLGGKDWLFVGGLMDATVRAEMPYTLFQPFHGLRRGTLRGASHDDEPLDLAVAPGLCWLAIEGPTGVVAGQKATTSVVATFNTAAPDPNPPYLSHFAVLLNGKPSERIPWGQRALVRFRAHDDSALRDVRLFYRLGAMAIWWPLALQRDGDQYTAALPALPAFLPFQWFLPFPRLPQSQEIPVSLKVVLRDAQGNTVSNELTPAFGYGGISLR